MPPSCVGGPHLRAVTLIHEGGRNLPGPRSHNDSLAIRYEPSEIATNVTSLSISDKVLAADFSRETQLASGG